MDAEEPRFLADAMLARLARWLRVLGFDTAFDPALDDPELVSLAAVEDRVLLTRDRHLVTHLRPKRALLLQSLEPLEQLREVVAQFDLSLPRELFTRCLICNARLRSATPDEVGTLLLPGSESPPEPVVRCDSCGRLYWHGSHVRRMRAALATAFPGREW